MTTAHDLVGRLRELSAAAPLLPLLDGLPEAWIVGGAVRDLLLGGAPLDLDLVVVGDAPAVAARLAGALGGELQVHDRFGTATVRAGGHSYDVVRARAESYPRPGALPEVRPGTLEEDLARRDFTVNAIALALDGRIAAAPHALEDLEARRLRVLHDASFRDDPTRLLRLVRYATRLGFAVEPATAALAREAIDAGALGTVTGTRIGAELRLLLREPSAADALAEVAGWGGGDALVPGLRFDAAPAERARALLPADGRDDLLLLAAACLRVAPAALVGWLDALGFTARERDTVAEAAGGAKRLGDRLAALVAGGAPRPSAVAALLRGRSPELAALAGALAGGERAGGAGGARAGSAGTGGAGAGAGGVGAGEAGERAGGVGPRGRAAAAEAVVRRWLERDRHVRLEIGGDDLRAAGVPQGEAIGRGLAAALAAKLDGDAPDREAELSAALAAAAARPA
ncbi:CCA tRNA nucleotidyltransferase [Conexibacter arvalis]|uniref:tRNA nucleotidyltransferase (CCA-adding enzyme) n=1 Tax=Conexibacter arvalis TaxID=912552 RepID=A0A840IF63_9ACTN|nr:CCA tRNA nucleotidyltransferase [Conexibacter arvalis]MBB4663657.1 tRNA nucleotidyltransferase (CCA-adding enzyme) [Conexibacter arvalis]